VFLVSDLLKLTGSVFTTTYPISAYHHCKKKYKGQMKKKGYNQTTVDKTLHRKLKIFRKLLLKKK